MINGAFWWTCHSPLACFFSTKLLMKIEWDYSYCIQGRVFGTEWNRLISLVQKYFFIGCAKKNLGKIWKISQKIPQKSSFFDIFKVPLEMYTRVLENCYALRTFRYIRGRNAIEKCVCWRICFKYFFWKNESVKTHTVCTDDSNNVTFIPRIISKIISFNWRNIHGVQYENRNRR